MGRWTPKHYDEVLVTKIENLVNGAIRRCKQDEVDEKNKMHLTYEGFVESLDEGDTFTTTLVEILVKELSDRQSRHSPADKRLITTRTSDSLRSLAESIGNYRSTPYSRLRNRSSANLNTAPTSLYDPSDSPDEEDFDDFGMVDSYGAIEGARIDSALYDVYSRQPVVPDPSRSYLPASAHGPRASDASAAYRPYESSSMMQRHLPVPHGHLRGLSSNSPRWSNVFGASSTASNNPNATSLVRHSSIRRPSRSRITLSQNAGNNTTEFSDFSQRRRSAQRLSANREAPESASPQVPTEGTPARLATEVQPVIPPPSSFAVSARSSSNLPRATLFDPPSPSAQDAGSRAPSPPPSLEAEAAAAAAEAHQAYRSAATTLAFLVHGSDENAGEPSSSSSSSWRTGPGPGFIGPRIPPLRRGGVPPPESLLSSGTSESAETTLASLLRPETNEESGLFEPSFDRDFGSWFDGPEGETRNVARTAPSETEPVVPAAAPSRGELELPTSLPTPIEDSSAYASRQ